MTEPPPPPSKVLFADQSLDEVVAERKNAISPLFERAKDFLERGDKRDAIKVLEEIAERRDIKSQNRLQAWKFLREAGGRPPRHPGQKALRVVFEVGMGSVHCLLSVYTLTADHH